ncbi:ACP S-malonyltransferase [Brevibacillus laterosporus]|uniref:ACP S-malonyltransferase n=1 Tax=Brevibacillus laterosporus TaxID=1465 RepID=UPI003D1EBFD9
MKKLAMMFTGQGSQYEGMGLDLYTDFEIARQTFEEASDTLGFDLKKCCEQSSREELTRTEIAQPAILTVSVSAFRVFMQEFGIEPSYLAGHSLGEYSALVCAEALSFQEAVLLVSRRGRFMQEAVPPGEGSMVAVRNISANLVADMCHSVSDGQKAVEIACYNSPDEMVIAGHREAVSRVSEMIKRQGAQLISLQVSAPFHCMLMKSAAERLHAELVKVHVDTLKWPVYSNVTGKPYDDQACIAELLTRQMTEPVRWAQIMQDAHNQGVELAIEFGPKTVLRNLTRKNVPTLRAFSFDEPSDRQKLGEEYPTVVETCIRIGICTKNRNNDEAAYQKGFVQPYHRLQEIQHKLKESGRRPDSREIDEAITCLQMMLAAKQTPLEEQERRMDQLYQITGYKQKGCVNSIHVEV